jgi:hypothetical protein
MNFVSFTHCSASKNFEKELSVSGLRIFDDLSSLSNEWLTCVNQSSPKGIAKGMYNGGGFKKLVKTLDSKSLFIISAGLGLIGSNDNIPSYECTVTSGKDGSIGNHLNRNLDIKQWWEFLKKSKYSRGSIFENIKNYNLVLLSLTSDYLTMISDDLKNIDKNFYIFTGNKELAIGLGFESNLMPYNEVFDGPNGTLRGTNRDFAQRTHADFIKRLNKYNSFDEAYESVEFDMQTWTPPTKHNNVKKTDEEILSLIKTNENKFSKVTDLLRYFRFELKVACEEKRFKSLYKNFKEIKECQKLL